MKVLSATIIFIGLALIAHSLNTLTMSLNSLQGNKTIFIDAVASCSPMPQCEKWLQELNKP